MVTLGPGPPEKTCRLPSASMTLRVPLRTNDFSMCDSGNMLPPLAPARLEGAGRNLSVQCGARPPTAWPSRPAQACAPPRHSLPRPANLALKAVRYHDLRLPTDSPTYLTDPRLRQGFSDPPNLLRRAQLRRPCRGNGARPQQGTALLLSEERGQRQVRRHLSLSAGQHGCALRDRTGGGAQIRRG